MRALTYTSIPWVDSKRRILIPSWWIASVPLNFLTLGGITSISTLIVCAMVVSAPYSIKTHRHVTRILQPCVGRTILDVFPGRLAYISAWALAFVSNLTFALTP